MNRLSRILRVLVPYSTLLAAVLLLSGCDSSDPRSDPKSDLTGRWSTNVPVNWAETFVLPAGAQIDSIRYQHVGTHQLTFDLTQTDDAVSGTVEWNVEGIYVEIQYVDGTATTDVDDANYTLTSDVKNGRLDASTLMFERSGLTNDWLSPLDAVELTLANDQLTGQFTHRYLITEWIVTGSPEVFTTALEFPVPVRLTQVLSSSAN